MRIFLIGMPGSGKSFWGKQWALQCGMPHVDTDRWIEENTGKTIQDIFQMHGEAYFRELETRCLRALCNNFDHAIISTGGGLPCYKQHMEYMKQQGLTIYLNVSESSLLQNLQKNTPVRPLFSGQADLKSFLRELYDQRAEFYQQAEIILTESEINTPTFLKHVELYVKN